MVLKARKEPLDAVVKLNLTDDEIVKRLSGRRTCPSCGASFHVSLSPPGVEGLCDACGGALRQRDDDREDVIRKRLTVYGNQTAPLASHYGKKGLLKEVDGSGPIDEVRKRILLALGAA